MNMTVTVQATQRIASCQASFMAQISQKLPTMDQQIRDIVAATFLMNFNDPKKFQDEIRSLKGVNDEMKK